VGANAVNLVRIMEGRDQPRALGAARRTRLGSSPYRRGARRPVLQSKDLPNEPRLLEVASASVRKRDPPPTPLHLHRVCFVRGGRNYSATRTSNWNFPTANDTRESSESYQLRTKNDSRAIPTQQLYQSSTRPALAARRAWQLVCAKHGPRQSV